MDQPEDDKKLAASAPHWPGGLTALEWERRSRPWGLDASVLSV